MDADEPIWLRPEHAALGRPAERSRAELTAAAVELADQEGLDAVSMRRVATHLGTGAASLYRYVAGRDDLLDLMTDAVSAAYDLPEPTGDALADLLEVARQARRIMLDHPWLATLVTTRASLGPAGVDLLEHVLAVLDGRPADGPTKLETFATLIGTVATFVRNEQAVGGTDAAARQQARYLQHVAAAGTHPRLADLVAADGQPTGTADDRFDRLVTRVLRGLLTPPR